MRLSIALAALLVPLAAEASIIVTYDGRSLDGRCEIKANEETLLGGIQAPSPPANWSATFTNCGWGFGHIDSAIDDDFISAYMWSQAADNSGFEEDVAVFFDLEFEVTAPSLAEWIDGAGFRLETLLPGTTYTIFDFVHATSVSQGRLEATASVRLIPEPATLGLLGLGLVGFAAGSRSLVTAASRRAGPRR